MNEIHPNIMLLQQLDIRDLSTAGDLIADNFVWHYVNPRLPQLEADYAGLAGFRQFFEMIGRLTEGNFHVQPVSAVAFGDELVVVHTRNSLKLQGQAIDVDVVVVWRVVNNQIVEGWDIPSAYTLASPEGRQKDELVPLKPPGA